MNYKNIIKEIEKVGEEGTHGLYEWRRYISAKASTTTWFGVWDVNMTWRIPSYFLCTNGGEKIRSDRAAECFEITVAI